MNTNLEQFNQKSKREQGVSDPAMSRVVSIGPGTDLNKLNSPFKGFPAGHWLTTAAQKPVPKMLFDEFWIEGELCVLFATTNTGKSILAVQIADIISKGVTVSPFRLSAPAQTVLYFDFELSDRQFTKRYSEQQGDRYTNLYKFSDRFLRYEKEAAAPPPGVPLHEFYIQHIEAEILDHEAKVIIIDNITWIKSRLEKASDAGPFMQRLNDLKKQYGLSILLIAHTPKRDFSSEITINDLQGSSMIMNFLDSAFAIGSSRKDSFIRYIKQVKVRDAEKRFDSENVIVCSLEKTGNFLGYTFADYSREKDHLSIPSDQDLSKRDAEIMELHRAGESYYSIAKQLGMHRQSVKRVIDRNDGPHDDSIDSSDDNDGIPF